MGWFKDLPRPVKYGIVAGGFGICTSVLAYQYVIKQRNKNKSTNILPEVNESFKQRESPDVRKVPESIPSIVIDIDSDEWATPSSSNICIDENPPTNKEEIIKKEPVEDISDHFDEYSKPSRKVLLLGLEKSGKSSLLSQLSREGTNCMEYEPTKGFNVVCISFDNVELSIWEIGGGEEYRTYWKNFCTTTDLIFFVVDSSDRDNFKRAKEFFYNVFNDLNDEIGFYIAATKADKENSASVEELREALGLEGTNWDILKVSVQAGGAKENIGVDKVQEYCLYQ